MATRSMYTSSTEEAKLTPMGRELTQVEEELEIVSPTITQKVGAELVGTFILVLIGCASGFIDQRHDIKIVGIAFAWGVVLMAMIYSLGHISGAHFNPAVTIAFATTGQFPWREVPLYVVGQLVGAIIASLSLRGLFDGDRLDVMLTLPAAKTDDLTVVVFEIIVSFILMWVICGSATDHRANKELAGVAIGATLFIDVLIAGKVTGASMNPARSIGPAIAAQNFHSIWIYIVAPVIGTVSGATLYNLLRAPKPSAATEKQASSRISNRLNPVYSEKQMEDP